MTEKESHRWLATMTEVARRLPGSVTAVMVSDRESDIFEYINCAVANGHKVLLRATHDRELVKGGHGHLLETLAAAKPLGHLETTVPRADGHKERGTIWLALRVSLDLTGLVGGVGRMALPRDTPTPRGDGTLREALTADRRIP